MKKKTTVTLLEGTSEFSEMAAKRFFGKNFEPMPRSTYADVFRCLEERAADHAVVAVENLVSGSVPEVYDLLFSHNVFVVGEVFLKVALSLVGAQGTDLMRIEKVYANAEALIQCRDFLQKRRWDVIPAHDVAERFGFVMKNKNAAAIATENAARGHGLRVLLRGVQDFPWNMTRYFLLGDRLNSGKRSGKTSITFVAKHIPGALFGCLEGFARQGINLSKIESRPVRSEPNKYSFFIDFEGNVESPSVQKALEALREKATFMKILGCYEAGESAAGA